MWIPADREHAERWIGGRVLSASDLPVVDFAVSTLSGQPVVRTRQVLPSGQRLELVQRAALGRETGPTPERKVEGRGQRGGKRIRTESRPQRVLSVTVGEVVITLRAQVSLDSLRSLARRLR